MAGWKKPMCWLLISPLLHLKIYFPFMLLSIFVSSFSFSWLFSFFIIFFWIFLVELLTIIFPSSWYILVLNVLVYLLSTLTVASHYWDTIYIYSSEKSQVFLFSRAWYLNKIALVCCLKLWFLQTRNALASSLFSHIFHLFPLLSSYSTVDILPHVPAPVHVRADHLGQPC